MPAHSNGVIIGYIVQFYIPDTQIITHKEIAHCNAFYIVEEEDNLEGACNTSVRVRMQFLSLSNNYRHCHTIIAKH